MDLFAYTYYIVKQIPPGKISTYGAVAKALGDIKAARAVGRMMNQNPCPDEMPCFKIVYNDGTLGGFGLGIDDKIRRLQEDGVSVMNGRILNFHEVFFDEFETEYPLNHLQNEQQEVAKQVRTTDEFTDLQTVAGFDVAYPKNDFDNCCGACVVMDLETKKIIQKKTVSMKIMFPYIPTYLFYREFSVIKEVLNKLTVKPSLLMLDGHGLLHPHHAGIASHAGVILDMPTIGIGKSLLYGTIEDHNIKIREKISGYVFYASPKIKKPIYISPGHKISLHTALYVVKRLCMHKIPEPLRQAHLHATTMCSR